MFLAFREFRHSLCCISNITPRNGKDENLIPNSYACKRLEFLLAGFAQGMFIHNFVCSQSSQNIPSLAAASKYNRTLEPLDKRISKYIGGRPIRIDGKPRASGVMDTVCSRHHAFSRSHLLNYDRLLLKIRAAIAHGIRVPPEFEEKSVVDVIVHIFLTLHSILSTDCSFRNGLLWPNGSQVGASLPLSCTMIYFVRSIVDFRV